MIKEYKTNLSNCAFDFDRMIKANGEVIKCVNEIIENSNKDAVLFICNKVVGVVENKEYYSTEMYTSAKNLYQALVFYLGDMKIDEILRFDAIIEDNSSFEELLAELNKLTGLKEVKEKINDLVIFQKVQKLRKETGLHSNNNTLHMAFTGNPGTGKTTVARIVGKMYKQLGLLSKGHFIEASRTDLIAGYQGQTALKVKKIIEKAKGGVLFIDEAYSITENENSDSYGRECLTELTKALEDYREDLVVIVAGYTQPMNLFFESNPGLKSRFNTFIEFPDYSAEELESILETICINNDYYLSDNAKTKALEYFNEKVEEKDDNFANGRMARNLYDNLVMNHAKRVILYSNSDKETLSLITEKDFEQLN